MIDYMLKFSDEQEALSVLFDGDTPKYTAVDMIGVITKVVDDSDPDNVVTEPIEGFHVNVRHVEEAEELEAFAVNPTPTTPERVWL